MDQIQARVGEEGVTEEEKDIPLRGEAHNVEVEKGGKMVTWTAQTTTMTPRREEVPLV